MTTSTAEPDISSSGELDRRANTGAIPAQRDDFLSQRSIPVSPNHRDARSRHRSLDEQTATDIAAGW